MNILGIESSCDETAAAVVTDQREILSNVVYSQLNEHKAYGGVVPEIAARAHALQMDTVVDKALKQANCTLDDIDAFAATAGPGLIGGVLVGAMSGKTLAAVTGKPLIMVNHLEGHALTARLTDNIAFPYLLLLISGGHCQWLEVREVGQYREIGHTIDDALGEAFDKVAKMMGLPYPGGPQIEKLAKQGNPQRFDLPRPLLDKPIPNMSFAGLKTAVRYQLQALHETDGITDIDKADMAASFQAAVCDILRDRLQHAMRQVEDISHLVVAGGVAANQAIKTLLEGATAKASWQLTAPPPKFCTDNAAMIAWAGIERLTRSLTDTLEFEPRARWPLTELQVEAHSV